MFKYILPRITGVKAQVPEGHWEGSVVKGLAHWLVPQRKVGPGFPKKS